MYVYTFKMTWDYLQPSRLKVLHFFPLISPFICRFGSSNREVLKIVLLNSCQFLQYYCNQIYLFYSYTSKILQIRLRPSETRTVLAKVIDLIILALPFENLCEVSPSELTKAGIGMKYWTA